MVGLFFVVVSDRVLYCGNLSIFFYFHLRFMMHGTYCKSGRQRHDFIEVDPRGPSIGNVASGLELQWIIIAIYSTLPTYIGIHRHSMLHTYPGNLATKLEYVCTHKYLTTQL